MSATSKEVRVKTLGKRFGYDGQTGIVVLAGTEGTVADLSLYTKEHAKPMHELKPADRVPDALVFPMLRVYWDYALVRDKHDDEYTVIAGWEENEIQPNELVYVGAVEAPAAEAEVAS